MAKRYSNYQLRVARISRHWSQREVADAVGTTFNNVSRWEQGITSPGPYFRSKLCDLFGKSAEELGLLANKLQRQKEQVCSCDQQMKVTLNENFPWYVPYCRNPFFTGREALLTHLNQIFQEQHMMPITLGQTLSGLGGIGKTQVAIEYAYRFRDQYQAVLWIQADTEEMFTNGVTTLVPLLQLPEQEEQRHMFEAVKHWLSTHGEWLLILDNIDDIDQAAALLPTQYTGHLLLTTRSQSSGAFATIINLECMEEDEGALLLLRRSKLLAFGELLNQASQEVCCSARKITEALGGLPLALEQAGAYIEKTQCNISDLLFLCQCHLIPFLKECKIASGSSSGVVETFLCTFEKIQRINPLAADLLILCSFLAAEAIPEEILMEAASLAQTVPQITVPDPFLFHTAYKILLSSSLIHRDLHTKTVIIRRLVQSIRREYLAKEEWQLGAKRIIRALNRAFPDAAFFPSPQCEQLLPHILEILKYLDQIYPSEQEFDALVDAVLLLQKAATYLTKCARYQEADFLSQRAIGIQGQFFA